MPASNKTLGESTQSDSHPAPGTSTGFTEDLTHDEATFCNRSCPGDDAASRWLRVPASKSASVVHILLLVAAAVTERTHSTAMSPETAREEIPESREGSVEQPRQIGPGEWMNLWSRRAGSLCRSRPLCGTEALSRDGFSSARHGVGRRRDHRRVCPRRCV